MSCLKHGAVHVGISLIILAIICTMKVVSNIVDVLGYSLETFTTPVLQSPISLPTQSA